MLLMLVNKKYMSATDTQEQAEPSKTPDVSKLPESKRISVLPRGPVVAAQESEKDLPTNWELHIVYEHVDIVFLL